LEITGIHGARVLAMEERLRQDVLKEAQHYGGYVLLHGEEGSGLLDNASDLHLYTYWARVTEETVKTPMQVYADLALKGLHIEFARYVNFGYSIAKL
jgi:hypothetical protein